MRRTGSSLIIRHLPINWDLSCKFSAIFRLFLRRRCAFRLAGSPTSFSSAEASACISEISRSTDPELLCRLVAHVEDRLTCSEDVARVVWSLKSDDFSEIVEKLANRINLDELQDSSLLSTLDVFSHFGIDRDLSRLVTRELSPQDFGTLLQYIADGPVDLEISQSLVEKIHAGFEYFSSRDCAAALILLSKARQKETEFFEILAVDIVRGMRTLSDSQLSGALAAMVNLEIWSPDFFAEAAAEYISRVKKFPGREASQAVQAFETAGVFKKPLYDATVSALPEILKKSTIRSALGILSVLINFGELPTETKDLLTNYFQVNLSDPDDLITLVKLLAHRKGYASVIEEAVGREILATADSEQMIELLQLISRSEDLDEARVLIFEEAGRVELSPELAGRLWFLATAGGVRHLLRRRFARRLGGEFSALSLGCLSNVLVCVLKNPGDLEISNRQKLLAAVHQAMRCPMDLELKLSFLATVPAVFPEFPDLEISRFLKSLNTDSVSPVTAARTLLLLAQHLTKYPNSAEDAGKICAPAASCLLKSGVAELADEPDKLLPLLWACEQFKTIFKHASPIPAPLYKKIVVLTKTSVENYKINLSDILNSLKLLSATGAWDRLDASVQWCLWSKASEAQRGKPPTRPKPEESEQPEKVIDPAPARNFQVRKKVAPEECEGDTLASRQFINLVREMYG